MSLRVLHKAGAPAFCRPAFRSKGSRRALSGSAPPHKALPFFLHNVRGGTLTKDEDGKGMLRMLMFGKPGAGKGTLTARLVKKYDIVPLSTGDLLRQHIAEKTKVGQVAEEIVAKGGLLPDELMLEVVSTKLDHLQDKHWILDGFPRTLGQGMLLDSRLRQQNMPLSLIVHLEVPDEVILSRISDRWVHLPSGRVYNLSYNRPKVDGFDDETGEPLIKRPDDNPEIFSRRLSQFYASTSPLLSFYASQPHTSSRLVSLIGKTSDEIWPQLEKAVKAIATGLRERAESRETRRRSSVGEAVLSRRASATNQADKACI